MIGSRVDDFYVEKSALLAKYRGRQTQHREDRLAVLGDYHVYDEAMVSDGDTELKQILRAMTQSQTNDTSHYLESKEELLGKHFPKGTRNLFEMGVVGLEWMRSAVLQKNMPHPIEKPVTGLGQLAL